MTGNQPAAGDMRALVLALNSTLSSYSERVGVVRMPSGTSRKILDRAEASEADLNASIKEVTIIIFYFVKIQDFYKP